MERWFTTKLRIIILPPSETSDGLEVHLDIRQLRLTQERLRPD